MGISEIIFWIIIILNTIVGVVYLCWAILTHDINEQGENERLAPEIRAICILICPVAALAFLLAGTLIEKLFFRNSVDLLTLLFGKERVEQMVKADVEREKNMASMEEALAVSDRENLRTLTMNVIKGDVESSLSAMAKALDSADSETSHYAAAVLSKELNDFRVNVKKIEHQMELEEEMHTDDHTERDRYGVMLLDYMNRILKQHVLTNIEQEYYVRAMDRIGERMYVDEALPSDACAGVANRLMEIGSLERAGVWCDRAMEQFPFALSSYQCKLRLLYMKEDREGFLEMLARLKKSGITVDNENMEMIRMFQ